MLFFYSAQLLGKRERKALLCKAEANYIEKLI